MWHIVVVGTIGCHSVGPWFCNIELKFTAVINLSQTGHVLSQLSCVDINIKLHAFSVYLNLR